MHNEKLHKFALNQLTNEADIEEVVSWIEASKAYKEEFETLWIQFANQNYYNDSFSISYQLKNFISCQII